MYPLLCDIISEIENKMDMIYEDMNHKNIFKKGIDNLHFINSKLNEIMRQSKKDLRNIISLADLLQK